MHVCERDLVRLRAIMATMGVPTSGEGVAAAALPQLERQSVCEKVESSRQWSEVKRGGPRKGERKRSWDWEGGGTAEADRSQESGLN